MQAEAYTTGAHGQHGILHGGLGGGGGIWAAGAGSTWLGAACSLTATFFFFALAMPTPRGLPIGTCRAHCTVSSSEAALCMPTVLRVHL